MAGSGRATEPTMKEVHKLLVHIAECITKVQTMVAYLDNQVRLGRKLT